MVLEHEDPRQILYRSPNPILTPESAAECHGAVANVVFPSGIDRRCDTASPNRIDVYYGMADDRIGAARLDVPKDLVASVDDSSGRVSDSIREPEILAVKTS
jgi:predicted GH43/DUF377 family glycosyl hydrolase